MADFNYHGSDPEYFHQLNAPIPTHTDAGPVTIEEGAEWPSKVYHLADGRMRIYVNKETHRVYAEGEDEKQISIIVEPRDHHV